ncbi:hypothetical protein, partial [Microcoleus sp. Pol12B4]|uniref:hypothetical protein n=1 Tax=Microcoleus sp. Pol12B4 TaxID=3055395 RepID=UPI002FCE9D21
NRKYGIHKHSLKKDMISCYHNLSHLVMSAFPSGLPIRWGAFGETIVATASRCTLQALLEAGFKKPGVSKKPGFSSKIRFLHKFYFTLLLTQKFKISDRPQI